MKTIVLSFEWHSYPIWIYDENHVVVLNNLPKEWRGAQEFARELGEAQKLYNSAFIDTPREFSFIGFRREGDMERIRSLLSEIRAFVKNNFPDGYLFEDQVDSVNELQDFQLKDDLK